jgi:tetratricopeptide (TPR) repeat protein
MPEEVVGSARDALEGQLAVAARADLPRARPLEAADGERERLLLGAVGEDTLPRPGERAASSERCRGRARGRREADEYDRDYENALHERSIAQRADCNDPSMGDRLRPLWDFDDLELSRERFLARLAEETTDAGRAEVLTQLARVESLRDAFERCDELLDDAEALGGVTARLLLERGRRERSSDREGAGLAEFRQAFELAQESGEDVLAADAAHMLALVDDAEAWTARGIEIAGASDDSGARYWLGPLYNNLGWTRFDAGDYEGALEAFELALAARERDDPRESSLQHAREAVDEARRALAGDAAL